MSPRYVDPYEALRAGVTACRQDQWHRGLDILTRLAVQEEGRTALPALFYSYLGLGIMRVEGRRHDGLALCRFAAEREPGEAELHANLGLAYLILQRRHAATRCLQLALQLHPEHSRVVELHEMLGVRRRPLFPWLRRSSPLNVIAGRLAVRYREWQEARREERELAAGETSPPTPPTGG